MPARLRASWRSVWKKASGACLMMTGSPSSGLTAPCLGTGRIRQEEGRAGTGVDMPDVENGPVLFAETPQRQPGLCGGLVRVGQFPSAAGEIVVLDVDQEKCRIHAVPPGVVPTIAACGGKYSSYFFVGMPSAAGMMPLRSKMPARPFSSMYSTPISCMIRTARNSFSPRSVRK